MAWENFKVEHQRLQVINAYIEGHYTMTELCKQYGISRKTAYKWYQRYLQYGEEGLKDHSKAPHSPNICYSKDQVERAINLKYAHLKWGPKKILAVLENKFPHESWPSPTRLYEIFKEYHLVIRRRFRPRIPASAPLGDLTACNDTWSVDFKGWFLTQDRERCEPLTINDCYTRYLIRCIHLDKHTADCVWTVFNDAFYEYGLPNRVRSDNGPPFGSTGVGRLTSLSIKLIKAGVIPEWIQPGHPEENGRHERFHLTLKQEVASPPKKNLRMQIEAMNQFQDEYNFKRPHEALNMNTPSSYYRCSPRKWDGILRAPEYNTKEMDVRKVGQNGCIWVSQCEYYIGQTLSGEYVGLQIDNNGERELYYGPVYLGKLDLNKGLEKPMNKKRRRT